MQTIAHPNPRFMSDLPRTEPAVMDSTAAKAYKTCPRLYFYKIVLGFREKATPYYFAFGGAYHKFREVLSKSYTDAASTADEEAMSAILIKALTAAGDYWQRRVKDVGEPPVGSKYEFLTGQRLLSSCREAFKHWKKERDQGRITVLHSEQSFIVTLKDGLTQIGGRADEILRWNGRLWGRDFKTSSKMGPFYDRTLEPNDQFTRYTLGESLLCGEPVQGQLVEVLYNTKKEGPKVVPLITTRTEAQLSQWEDEQIYLSKQLAQNRENDIWPQQEIHCPFCAFRLVCKAPNEGSAMAQLKQGFEHKPWDFSTVGEEGDENAAE